MAFLKGAVGGFLAEIESVIKALRVAHYPRDVSGSYCYGIRTGLLAAALAADAPIWAMRNGPTGNTKNIYFSGGFFWFITTTAFTAAQEFGFYLQRFSVANLAGGTAVPLPVSLTNNGTASAVTPGGAEAGDIRTSTTTALTSAGVTFDANKVIPVINWRDPTINLRYGPFEFRCFEWFGQPWKLVPGEGIVLRNLVVWPAAGVGMVSGGVGWEERTT